MKDITLTLDIEGRKLSAPKSAYARAKLKQLKEFGYSDLTLQEVYREIDSILAGKTLTTGLTIIGGFMEKEIILPKST